MTWNRNFYKEKEEILLIMNNLCGCRVTGVLQLVGVAATRRSLSQVCALFRLFVYTISGMVRESKFGT